MWEMAHAEALKQRRLLKASTFNIMAHAFAARDDATGVACVIELMRRMRDADLTPPLQTFLELAAVHCRLDDEEAAFDVLYVE
jgi:hypothetical protein